MNRSKRKRILAGWMAGGTLLLGLTAYLYFVGLDKADKVASGVAAVLALAALLAPYLLPAATFEPARQHVTASGAGAVTIAGTNSGEVGTEVSGTSTLATPSTGGINASGPGSVAIGGDSTASIHTHVTGPDQQSGQKI